MCSLNGWSGIKRNKSTELDPRFFKQTKMVSISMLKTYWDRPITFEACLKTFRSLLSCLLHIQLSLHCFRADGHFGNLTISAFSSLVSADQSEHESRSGRNRLFTGSARQSQAQGKYRFGHSHLSPTPPTVTDVGVTSRVGCYLSAWLRRQTV